MNYSTSFIEKFKRTISDVLFLEDVDVTYKKVNLTDQLTGETDTGALLGSPDGKKFVVYLHNEVDDYEELLTIAHELKHVQQIVSGRYSPHLDGFYWLDNFYKWTDKNGESEHEQEALEFEEVADLLLEQMLHCAGESAILNSNE